MAVLRAKDRTSAPSRGISTVVITNTISPSSAWLWIPQLRDARKGGARDRAVAFPERWRFMIDPVTGPVREPASREEAIMGSFESTKVFALRAPAGRVHEAVTHPETWLANCGLLRELRMVQEGDPSGLGARHHAVLLATPVYAITWELETVRSVPGRLVEWAARGDIEGYGLWELEQEEDVTRVVNTWRVRPTQPWMGLASPFARGLVAHEHNRLMRQGVRELATHLAADVVTDLCLYRAPGRGYRGSSRLADAGGPASRRPHQHP